MYTPTLEETFTLKALKKAYAQVSRTSVGLDRVSVELFEEDLTASLTELRDRVRQGRYTPEPLSRIYVPKEHSTDLRPLGLGSLGDKVIQKALAIVLGEYFEPLFSDASYGYRPGRGVVRAIGRVRSYLQRGMVHIYRLDIENFFESIPHEALLSLLERQIGDDRIVALIALFLKNGAFERYRYLEHIEGIHQGDPLSPLLANIYLNQLDWFLSENNVAFVRFADDLVLLAHSAKAIHHIETITHRYLTTLGLQPNPTKSHRAHAVKEGFSYLGIAFKGHEISIARDKLDQIITRQNTLIRSTHPMEAMIEALGIYLAGLSRYYEAVIDERHVQFRQLQDALILALSERVTLERKRGRITTRKAFVRLLSALSFPYILSATQRKDILNRIISQGLTRYLETKRYRDTEKKIRRKKRKYAKEFATASTLYIAEPGTFMGVARHTITLKQKGRVVYTMPKHQCERIIVASPSVSLSGALVKLCAEQGIAIDFLDPRSRSTPYASLYTARNSYARMSLLQLHLLETPQQMQLARAFIKGKLKNQINYLKYLDKYHHILSPQIDAMEARLALLMTQPQTPNELMGLEGQSAVHYWQGVSRVLEDKVDFPGRVTYGAKDVVNSALNYSYAILYSRVQFHAVRAGLSLHISFLHALDDAKPTLVYDMIEEFRAFVVDRVIITMFNQREPIRLDKEGRLDTRSRQLITRKVLEKIGSYTRHGHASKKIDTIIADQAYRLARAIRGLTTYRPFVGRY